MKLELGSLDPWIVYDRKFAFLISSVKRCSILQEWKVESTQLIPTLAEPLMETLESRPPYRISQSLREHASY